MGPTIGTRKGSKAATSPSPSPAISLDRAIDEGKALGQPPKKKFKLTVRPPAPRAPSDDGDTIAVSRPKRKLIKPGKYSEPGPLNDNGNDEAAIKASWKTKAPSPAESSGLSSLDSRSVSVTSEVTPDPPAKTSHDDYGDFMSFYIADGDDEPTGAGAEQQESAAPVVATARPGQKQVKGGAKKHAPQSGPMQLGSLQHGSDPMHPHQRQQMQHPQQRMPAHGPHPPHLGFPPGHPNTRIRLPRNSNKPPGPYHHLPAQASMHMIPQQPPPPPIPGPTMPEIEAIDVRHQAGAKEMAMNLKELSDALAHFGHNGPAMRTDAPATMAAPADKLLAFLDDDSASEDEKPPEREEVDDRLRQPGEQDEFLAHGIQFIMNALKSWAQQTQWQNLCHRIHRGEIPIPTGPIEYSLAGTPEERAIKAMRKVIESSCIQVNALLPQDLSDALRRLYMQIHAMINQENNRNPEWRPMSYAAQIEAHAARLQRHRHYILAQQNGMYAQHAAHQQAMQQQQMGMPQMPNGSPGHTGFPGHGPPLQQHPPGAPRPRNGPSLQQQQQQQQQQQRHHQRQHQHQHQQRALRTVPSQSTPPDTNPPRARLPFSGQSLQFSFDHQNPAAYEAFGQGAFPAPQGQSTIPNRGPMMSAPPAVQPVSGPHIHDMFGKTAESNGQRGSSAGSDSHAHPAPPVSVVKTPQPANGFTPVNKVAAKRKSVDAGTTTDVGTGFTAVNKPATHNSPSAVAGAAAPVVEETIPITESSGQSKRKRRPTAGALASQKEREKSSSATTSYPHPCAVVIDE
ncbi:hypothetical protein B0A48_13249 [Cryoendolithus antarcticus]|uniref:Uncharacterized protein n=1 Tax=Cryoendolithus antarcticus TaxID=1507870 RepID=A0A1V8SPA9_9PEZI|nr:hypothetical protein B0A48_13249 [Cryoendolithus antarcticus]